MDLCNGLEAAEGGATEESFGDKNARSAVETGTRMCRGADVEEAVDRGAVRRQAGERTPQEKLAWGAGAGIGVAVDQIDVGLLKIGGRDDDAFADGGGEIGNLTLELVKDSVGEAFAKRFGPLASAGLEFTRGITGGLARQLLKLEPEYPLPFRAAGRIDGDGLAHDDGGIGREKAALGFVHGARNAVKAIANVDDGGSRKTRISAGPARQLRKREMDLHVRTAIAITLGVGRNPSRDGAGVEELQIELLRGDVADDGAARRDKSIFHTNTGCTACG